jgi:CheY-like chemotaxis protein
MNGEILVESEYGVGSTFTLTIPMDSEAESGTSRTRDIKASPPTAMQREESLRLLEECKNKTILIVDDNLMNLEVVGLTLKKFGFKVLFAENGVDAVDMVEKKGVEINLILMDLQMPILDGFQATEKIRHLPAGEKIPIIAFSARTFDSDRERCFECGMNDHIAKPFDRQALMDKITKYLNVAN